MENPSPLFLGQEFVRQYYLLLNKNPDMMHRLYRSNSSYVHGEFDPNGTLAEAVYGQKEIYEKIKSLQFSECHTNIRHVAAHAILNDGIVVQVLGDLSNSGQPMRTFRQTLVLVPESSVDKKFYILNNIFCYEDEVFENSDAVLDEGGRDGELGDTDYRRIVRHPDSHQLFVGNIPHDIDESELKEFFMTYGNVVKLRIKTRGVGRKLPNFGFVVFDDSDPVQRILDSKPLMFRCEVNLNVDEKTTRAFRERGRREMRPNDREPRGSQVIVGSKMMRQHNGGRDGELGDTDYRRIVRHPDSHQLFVGNIPHDIDESELKEFFMTYGNVVKLQIKTRGVGRKLPNFGFVVFDDSDPVQRILDSKPLMFRGEVNLNVDEKTTRAFRERGRREMRPNDREPRGSQVIVGSKMMRQHNGGRDGELGDTDYRRIVRHPDSHQLFVGNIPHDIDESELKEFFMTYGNVVKLQIKTRGVGRKLPNFGFVVFDDSDPVQRILEAKPLMFRGEVNLNVDEKTTRAFREQGRREMRPNDREPRGSQVIVGSKMMRQHNGGRDGELGDTDYRRIVRHPDSHQLFVGNIPHDIDESELKEFFMTYGNVVKLRIINRGVGRKLPNFGFVVFDDSDPVQRILEAKPLMFRGEVNLNVDEKTTRAFREQGRREMRPNDREPRGSQVIVGSKMMRQHNGGRDGELGDTDYKRIVRHPDSHQLFVGNIAHDIDESELKEFFMTYGNVVELRIKTRAVGRKLPNFGFVVFDDSDPVQRILEAKPLMFRGEVNLNVDEKTTRAFRERC
ncbi:ras GTPase-activating protein-binding protein 2-like isoform X3 [Gouania willdenowi]|uniref:ras GTPase-activating protein-binding protein 2-like isoform X3 n=1 Tax=Gouania willdenowi TaxID=441366 RepID=UPI0010548AF2|nr:ras GTPase-activating protein-binding protein 2-like isoform X3 [Gouania willdenowi]